MSTRLSGPERRQTILSQAQRLFAEKGFHGVSIDEISRAVNGINGGLGSELILTISSSETLIFSLSKTPDNSRYIHSISKSPDLIQLKFHLFLQKQSLVFQAASLLDCPLRKHSKSIKTVVPVEVLVVLLAFGNSFMYVPYKP